MSSLKWKARSDCSITISNFNAWFQDNRLVDIALSYPFLKMICQGEVSSVVKEKSHIVQQNDEQELMTSSMYSVVSEESDLEVKSDQNKPWFSHLLGIEDLQLVDPNRGEFLNKLQELISAKQAIISRIDLSDESKNEMLEQLCLDYHGHQVRKNDEIHIIKFWAFFWRLIFLVTVKKLLIVTNYGMVTKKIIVKLMLGYLIHFFMQF